MAVNHQVMERVRNCSMPTSILRDVGFEVTH